MKAIMLALGSRGDIEPFLAIGEVLRRRNWEVICVFPEQFREMTEAEGFVFHGFSKEFLEVLLKSETAHIITGGEGSFFKRIKTLIEISKKAIKINKGTVKLQREIILEEKADFVFYHQKCIYPPVWGMANPGKSIVVSPIPCIFHSVYKHSMIGLKGGGDYGRWLNKLSYFLPNLIRSIVYYNSVKKFKNDFGELKLNPFKIKKYSLEKEKTLYTISPTLFSRPTHWPEAAQVVGYFERSKTNHWIPDRALTDFVAAHQKIVFITFGSISNPRPKEKTALIIEVLSKHKIAAIINTSWGGLVKPGEYPDHIHFVQNIPYEWIFPQVYAVIHHGGSGTTHTALKHGCASLVIPHFIDQFFWNRTVVNLGAGPKGVSIKKLSVKNFEPLLLDLLEQKSYKQKAEWIAAQMKQEASDDDLLQAVLQ